MLISLTVMDLGLMGFSMGLVGLAQPVPAAVAGAASIGLATEVARRMLR
ncbi:hypothetical protein Ade02nite_72550 [Paractinoplanes deccanensis]|uniref:Uncharacterized protein n=1 Tax=Paractinoplanes deccanensis TaxID=113561 RepID=A0ABQ3YF36_9ACTN|nr:hypothetical protein Ade02nite_72550 [Actinoplanes deccanensis]